MEALSLAPMADLPDTADAVESSDVRRNRLQRVFASCCDGLYRYLLVRVGSRDAADDLLQQACFIAAGKRRLPEALDECEAMLFGIAKNLVKKHWRRERVRGRHVPLLDVDAAGGAALVEAMDSGPLPSGTLESGETARRLQLAVTMLPSSQQHLVYAFYFQGRSHTEIASARGVTPKSVETQLYRIRARLRALLKDPKKEGER